MSLNFNNATASDMTNAITNASVSPKSTEGVQDQEETGWTNQNWTQYWGYFNDIPDLKSALIMKAIWNVGKGWKTDTYTKIILEHISGWGKDTFDDILFNMELTRRIAGDAFAEIVRDEKTKLIINLKVLDPGSMKIIVGRNGMIKRYEQITKIKGGKNKIFQPNEIFHLCNNRIADQIHGISDIASMEDTILAELENFQDMKKLMHRQVKPFILWKLKTDDQAKINQIVSKIDKARNLGEDMFIPDDDDAVEYEIVQVNVQQAIFEWRNDIRNKFYRTIGLPQIVPGAGGQSTESESKVIYLAFEQLVEKDQRYLEQQLWHQLQIKLDLIPPTSLMENLQSDTGKDGAAQQLNVQPGEVTPGVG